MRVLNAFATAAVAASFAASSQAQLVNFYNTGQKTKDIVKGKITQKEDQAWTVTRTNQNGKDPYTHLGWVAAPFQNGKNKVTFADPGNNANWIYVFSPDDGWEGQPFATMPTDYNFTYTTTFSVGKLGVTDFNGEYASFENVTSLKLNGMNPASGGSNTFLTNPTSQKPNSYNAWTDFSFGALAEGNYTLVASVSDTVPTKIQEMVGRDMNVYNPAGFVLEARGTAAPEPAPLIALPVGLLLLRRRRKASGMISRPRDLDRRDGGN